MIVNFLARTKKKFNYYEIKRRCYIAGAHIIRDKTIELNGEFEGIIEISSYRGSLYKEIEITKLAELELSLKGGIKDTDL